MVRGAAPTYAPCPNGPALHCPAVTGGAVAGPELSMAELSMAALVPVFSCRCFDEFLTSKVPRKATEGAAASVSGSAENFCCDSSAAFLSPGLPLVWVAPRPGCCAGPVNFLMAGTSAAGLSSDCCPANLFGRKPSARGNEAFGHGEAARRYHGLANAVLPSFKRTSSKVNCRAGASMLDVQHSSHRARWFGGTAAAFEPTGSCRAAKGWDCRAPPHSREGSGGAR